MKEKVKVLIAYDGSECADIALEDLKRAGLSPEAEALVMCVADVFVPSPVDKKVEDTVPMYVTDVVRRAHERAQLKLEEARLLAKQASEHVKSVFPGWQVRYEALADSPAWTLIRTAEQWNPNLIVMGARGHSVFGGRLILGSISQRVLYEAPCSVRIARMSRKNPDEGIRLLVGVDQSGDSNAAVDAICNRQWPRGSEVGVLAVVDTVMAINADSPDASAMKWIEVSDEQNWDQVREIFEPFAEKLRRAGLHAEVLIRRGSPADQILEEADTWGADCILVGARGIRGIDRLLLGSVSSAVSARAHCSVEVVRPNR
ncbi:MAG TPA: universal stress protein [Pyrinomonadaceae bacterium]|nr:universal stress protein [Pyrinomonadaceae bacterium]